jgi:hypothetical protein
MIEEHPVPVLIAGLLDQSYVAECPPGRGIRVVAGFGIAKLVGLMREMRFDFCPKILGRPFAGQNIFNPPILPRRE